MIGVSGRAFALLSQLAVSATLPTHRQLICSIMSLKIVPSDASKTATVGNTSGSYGVHDTLRFGLRNLASEASEQSALKHHLDNWEETQDNLKLVTQRNMFGIHAPLRITMERKLVATNPHMSCLPRSNLHLDILMGRDEEIDFHDIFGERPSAPPMNIHLDMERK